MAASTWRARRPPLQAVIFAHLCSSCRSMPHRMTTFPPRAAPAGGTQSGVGLRAVGADVLEPDTDVSDLACPLHVDLDGDAPHDTSAQLNRASGTDYRLPGGIASRSA